MPILFVEQGSEEPVILRVRARVMVHHPATAPAVPFVRMFSDHLENTIRYFCRIDEMYHQTLRPQGEILVMVSPSGVIARSGVARSMTRLMADLTERLAIRTLPAMGALAERGLLREDLIRLVQRSVEGLPLEIDFTHSALIRNLRHP